MSYTKQEVIQLFEWAKDLMYPNLMELKESYRYTFPSKEFEHAYNSQTQIMRQWLYDSTAIKCVGDLQTNIMSLLIPSSQEWADITFKKDKDQTKWGAVYASRLETANNQFFQHLAYSNFYQAAGECLTDSIITGTACLAPINIPGKPLAFMPIPINQLYFTEDFDGRVDNVFREHEKTTIQLISQFGKKVLSKLGNDSQNPTQKHRIIEAALRDPYTGQVDYTIYLESNWEPIVEPVTSQHRPFHVWRWAKNVGNPWGESPIRQALPAIRSLNTMIQCTLAYGEFASQGLWQTHGESTNQDNLRSQLVPGTLVFTEEEIKPIPFPGQFSIGQELISDTRQQIRDILLNKPQRDINKTPVTAEQIINERDEFFKMIGEPARRLQDEFLQPTAEDVFRMLCDRGEIELGKPDQLKQIDPKAKDVSDVFHIEVTAAITKVLKVQEAQQDLQAIQVAAQTFGEQMIYQIVDLEALARKTMLNLGLSQDVIRSPKDSVAIAKQMQQQQAMAQSSPQLTEVAKTASKTPAGQSLINSLLSNAADIRNNRSTVGATESLANGSNLAS